MTRLLCRTKQEPDHADYSLLIPAMPEVTATAQHKRQVGLHVRPEPEVQRDYQEVTIQSDAIKTFFVRFCETVVQARELGWVAVLKKLRWLCAVTGNEEARQFRGCVKDQITVPIKVTDNHVEVALLHGADEVDAA